MLVDLRDFTRAPGRGRYERGRSGTERFRAQRERLLRAVAIAHLEGAPSVTRATALSGVGRNTFYECFDDFEHALAAARREELQRFRRGLSGLRAHTVDGDGVDVLCRAWLELIAAEPVRALAALEPVRGERGSTLVTAFREALARISSGSGKSGSAERASTERASTEHASAEHASAEHASAEHASAVWGPGERDEGSLFHAAVCAEASGRALALALLSSSQASPESASLGEGAGDGLVPGEAVLALARSVRCLLGA